VRHVASSAERCRSPRCPRVGSATAAPASSIRRPTTRNARSLRRRRPNRSADGGNCSRPRATACAGKSRSARGRRCAADAMPRWCSAHNVVTMSDSWAVAAIFGEDLRGSPAWNSSSQIIVPQFGKYQWFGWRCSKGSMDAENRYGYPFHNARMTESFDVEPLPPLVLGLARKEPN
jgi:hypothetical protein